MKNIILLFFSFPIVVLSQNWLPVDQYEDHIQLEYTGFTLSYSPGHKQAIWVAYELTNEEVNGSFPRKGSFRPDNRVKDCPTTKDYVYSGYDRGHLIPAADLKWSSQAMFDSFYMTNISPQKADFNRKKWLDLEKWVRYSTYSNSSIWVITGGVLEDNLPVIKNGISIPSYFYKVIYSPSAKEGVAFLMPNEKLENDLSYYVKSIDDIENITGIDFFPSMEDSQEEIIESVVNTSFWKIK